MPKKAQRVSRYSTKEAALRIERAMGRSRPVLSNKEVAAAIEMTDDLFSRKLRMKRSTFTLEEMGAIADFFDAPPGWPVLDADVRKGK
jgi:hypothetical protein